MSHRPNPAHCLFSVSKVLLKHSHTHSLILCPWDSLTTMEEFRVEWFATALLLTDGLAFTERVWCSLIWRIHSHRSQDSPACPFIWDSHRTLHFTQFMAGFLDEHLQDQDSVSVPTLSDTCHFKKRRWCDTLRCINMALPKPNKKEDTL